LRSVAFRVHDRKRTEVVESSGRTRELSGDFVTPFAVRTRELDRQNILSLGLLGFLRGDRFSEETGLYPLETPSTDKIPVVFVHGLLSEPNTWRFLHAALLADPVIRQKYQFWAFQYPSSTPVQWSSTRLRQSLAQWQQRMDPDGTHTNLHRVVLVGHSMGGLLSRMQIVQGGSSLYGRYFTRSIDELRVEEPQRRMLRDMFFFEPNPRVERVVFICVPHRGSPMATDWTGRAARYLARLPITALEVTADLLTFNRDALTVRGRIIPGSSIESLRPNSDTVRLLDELPMDPRVRVTSIIGCHEGCGDPSHSTDGVVPYWSSHLDGVPETVIPSDHSGHNHPVCAEQVSRLLHEHLQP
jgi:pimeloyl-ACP methyl ester carboxylesterase